MTLFYYIGFTIIRKKLQYDFFGRTAQYTHICHDFQDM